MNKIREVMVYIGIILWCFILSLFIMYGIIYTGDAFFTTSVGEIWFMRSVLIFVSFVWFTGLYLLIKMIIARIKELYYEERI